MQKLGIHLVIRWFLLSKEALLDSNFIKHVKFIVRKDLKHMAGMLKNQRLLEQGNNRILIWNLWFDGYDIETEYKPGKYNSLVDLLTREGSMSIVDCKVLTRKGKGKSPMEEASSSDTPWSNKSLKVLLLGAFFIKIKRFTELHRTLEFWASKHDVINNYRYFSNSTYHSLFVIVGGLHIGQLVLEVLELVMTFKY